MSKKLFAWTSSLKKPNKLATDAVVLEENQRNSGDSSDTIQSRAVSITPSTPEMRLSRQFDNEHSMSAVRTSDSLVDPFNTSNSLSLNSVQQNVYNFSHINGLLIGTNVQINNNIEPSPERRSNSVDGIQKTRSIDVMMRSNEPVNERVMDVISTHLGENWRGLFRHLGFSDGQIDQMKEDYHPNGVKEVIYRLLLDYSRNNDDASLGHLTKLMWKLGYRECVAILKRHWKNGDLVSESETNNANSGGGKGKTVE
ncbi:protein immune deficiency [Bradysia coprophila]|uniref:protein immune deficiency n=1 Tax=Bradysia coprophila TaxID=38358 RepID=UPI00187D73FD|nr:protein immune deficiency [Bradysia coprophila]